MADWAVTGVGVGVAVLVALLVHVVLRTRRVFQNPTGADIARLAGTTAEQAGATSELSEAG